ncbi:hypothetical protein ST47_g7319 [Ascochyta rabiei]|uniref:Uncharacterized protein n=1 Tax=Didymella rabiei TaxID=5454 RepID=A0A163B4I8_DIDRA|nr:hypothetical protein ST47_g7319 [Ascochyta rabiei]
MPLQSQQDEQKAHDLYNLALSASQAQARKFSSDQLFWKHKDKHIVEVTRITSDPPDVPTIHNFTSCLPLSAYFAKDTRKMNAREPYLEI